MCRTSASAASICLRSQEATATGTNAQDINAVDFGAAYLPQNQDPTLPATSIPGARAKTTDLLRPYRGLGAINIQWPRNWDQYHSLQASLNRRFRNGLQFGFNYTLGLSYTGNIITPLRLEHAADGSFSFRADQAEQDELLEADAASAAHLEGQLRMGYARPRTDRPPARALVRHK